MNIKEQLLEILEVSGSKHISRIVTSKANKELLKNIKKETSFLGETPKIIENIYCIINNIKEIKLCKECKNKKVGFKGFGKGGYREFCCVSCSKKNKDTQEKFKASSIKRFGVDNPNKSEEIKKKKEETCMKNYGKKSYFQTNEFREILKESNLEKYGVEYYSQNKENLEKTKKYNLEKYGKEYYFQTEDFNIKKNITFNEKYGTNNLSEILRSKKVRNKKEKTSIEKYGVIHPSKSKIVKEKKIESTRKKYGVDYVLQLPEVRKKIRDTNKSRYGVDCIFSSKIFINIIKNTMLKKYGVENPSNSNDLMNKKIKKYFNKTGYHSPLCNPEVRKKIENTKLEKYGNKNPGNFNKSKNIIDNYNNLGKRFGLSFTLNEKKLGYNMICENCGNKSFLTGYSIYNRLLRYNMSACQNCFPLNYYSISGVEKKFSDFISDIYTGEIEISNRKILEGKEIDILLSDINLGIEINGLYWHSDKYKDDKNYHLNKTLLAKEKGIQLLHFFDDEINRGMELVYSLISGKGLLKGDLDISLLNSEYGLNLDDKKKIYARKLLLKSHNKGITGEKKKYKELLEKHHIQGKDNAGYYYSLEDSEGKIYSIMTFKKMSVDKNQQKNNNGVNNSKVFELSRYVTIPGVQVIGGFSKLLKAFSRFINSEFEGYNISLLTYSNLRYSDEDNNVYLRNGFNKVGFTGISYYYFFEGRKLHRFNFRKDNLYNKYLPERGIAVSDNYKEESEKGMVQKLIDNGYPVNKVYDCGHIKWIKELK